jgi:sterol desaturase/sphingolipid hydroxylase (fatty acid hydroxylase superfamily)
MPSVHFYWWEVFVVIASRYLVLAGSAWLVFYIWKRRRWWWRKIQQRMPARRQVFTEIGFSLLTLFILATVGWLIVAGGRKGINQVYINFSDYPGWYFAASILLTILLHDAYFYWTHRFMHWKPIFPYVHKVHHLSHNPTPWAAFAFHPLEAIIEAGILPLATFLYPMHPYAIGIFTLYMLLLNILGHLGYELFPKNFVRSKWTNWHNTSTHHNMHHRYTKGNYSLYFNWWDKWMGTNHKRYAEEFEEVKKRED